MERVDTNQEEKKKKKNWLLLITIWGSKLRQTTASSPLEIMGPRVFFSRTSHDKGQKMKEPRGER